MARPTTVSAPRTATLVTEWPGGMPVVSLVEGTPGALLHTAEGAGAATPRPLPLRPPAVSALLLRYFFRVKSRVSSRRRIFGVGEGVVRRVAYLSGVSHMPCGHSRGDFRVSGHAGVRQGVCIGRLAYRRRGGGGRRRATRGGRSGATSGAPPPPESNKGTGPAVGPVPS